MGKIEGKRNGGKKGERRLVADNTKSSMIPMAEKNPILQKEEEKNTHAHKKTKKVLEPTSASETDLSEEAVDKSHF